MATIDMVCLRAEINIDGDTNGGFPINAVVSEASFFDNIYSAQDPLDFTQRRKKNWWFKSITDEALYVDEQLFNQPSVSNGDHYVNFIVCTLREKWEDILVDISTRRRYGVGELTQDANAGEQTLTFSVKNDALATGDEKIFYADDATLTDNIIIDGRSIPGSLDPEQFERIVGDNVTSAVDEIVTVHLETPLVNSYVIGAKVQSTPDQTDLSPSYSDVNKSSLNSTTIDETAFVLYNAGTWEDNLTITMQGTTGTFAISSLRYGDYPGTFSKSVDNSFTWSELGTASPQITIPAGTIAGTHADGDFMTIETHIAGMASFIQMFHPAYASVKRDDIKVTTKWEE